MKDFSFWEEYEGTSEGSGRSEKIWLQNPDTGQTGLFKFKKDEGTTDHVSECIAYQLATLLEIPCARFELGTYKNREGSMSYNIIENNREVLIEGINFICLSYPAYDSESFIDLQTQDRYSIQMIEKSIKKFVPKEDFLKMLIFDFIIGNTDRHQSNWALILSEEHWRWSPLYDNSSSLCAYVAEEQISSYLGKDKTRWNALVDTKSKSLIRCTVLDSKRPTHLEVMRFIKKNYFAETVKFVDDIQNILTETQICGILSQYLDTELTDNKKILIKKFLVNKVQMLKEIYFGKEERHVN